MGKIEKTIKYIIKNITFQKLLVALLLSIVIMEIIGDAYSKSLLIMQIEIVFCISVASRYSVRQTSERVILTGLAVIVGAVFAYFDLSVFLAFALGVITLFSISEVFGLTRLVAAGGVFLITIYMHSHFDISSVYAFSVYRLFYTLLGGAIVIFVELIFVNRKKHVFFLYKDKLSQVIFDCLGDFKNIQNPEYNHKKIMKKIKNARNYLLVMHEAYSDDKKVQKIFDIITDSLDELFYGYIFIRNYKSNFVIEAPEYFENLNLVTDKNLSLETLNNLKKVSHSTATHHIDAMVSELYMLKKKSRLLGRL